MKYRRLGATDLDVSEVGFGVWTVSTNWWGKIEEADGIRLLQRAHDIGVSYFDTADAYGAGENEEYTASRRAAIRAAGSSDSESSIDTSSTECTAWIGATFSIHATSSW